MKVGDKKASGILVGNIMFIILNLIFLSMLIVFLIGFSGGVNLLEENYSKQIALLIDSSRPNGLSEIEIYLNMEDAIEKANEKKWNIEKIVKIEGNIVSVKLHEESNGYDYSYFNDVKINSYSVLDTEQYKGIVLEIGGYNG